MTQNPFIPNGTGAQPDLTPAPSTVTPPAPMPGMTPPSGAADQFEVDLTEMQNAGNVPDGEYNLQCIEVEQGVSRADNPMYIWTFVIPEGEHAGKEFRVHTALTPAAMWKVAEVVEALGVGSSGQVVRFKRSDVVGKRCRGVIEKQSYNGQERSQVARVLPLAP